MSHFQQATPEGIYNELKEIEAKVEQAGQNVHFSGQNAAQKKAEYEDLKNKMLIQMFADENTGKSPKRTEAQRQSLYRTTYAEQRLAWQLAENEWKASSDYLKGLLAMLTAIQTRMKILEADWRMTRTAT